MEINDLIDKKSKLERDLIKAVSNIIYDFQANNDIVLDDIYFNVGKIEIIGKKPFSQVIDVKAKIIL